MHEMEVIRGSKRNWLVIQAYAIERLLNSDSTITLQEACKKQGITILDYNRGVKVRGYRRQHKEYWD